jgi:O-antigen/teichoic acid export membrane protein
MIRSAGALQISRMMIAALSLLTGAIIARELGAAGLGQYGALLALAVFIQSVGSVGFEDLVLAAAPKAGAESGASIELYRKTLQLRIVFFALMSLLGLVVGLLNSSSSTFSSSSALGFALVYAGANGIATLGSIIQAARADALRASVLDAVWAGAVAAGCGLLGAAGALTVEGAIALTSTVQVIVSCVYVWDLRVVLFGSSDRTSAHGVEVLFKARALMMFWLNGLLSFGAGKNVDVLVIGLFGATAQDIGLYSAAFALYVMASQLPMQGIGTMLYVGLGRTYAAGSRSKIALAWRSTVVISIFMTIPCMIFVGAFADSLLGAFYGSDLVEAAPILLLLAAFGVFARIGGGGSNQAILFLESRTHSVLYTRMGFVSLNIILDVLLYKLIGIEGVAVATGVCGLLISITEYLLCRRDLPLQTPWWSGLSISGLFVCSALVAAQVPLSGFWLKSLSFGVLFLSLGCILILLVKPLLKRDFEFITSSMERDARMRRVLALVSRPPVSHHL